jgi:hypothetical protein
MILVPSKLARCRFPTLGMSEQAICLVQRMPARRALCPFSPFNRIVMQSLITTMSSARQKALNSPRLKKM